MKLEKENIGIYTAYIVTIAICLLFDNLISVANIELVFVKVVGHLLVIGVIFYFLVYKILKKKRVSQKKLELKNEQLKVLNQDLKKSKKRFDTLFNNIDDALFVHKFDKNEVGEFIEVNDTACRRLGYSREELLEMKPEDITKQISLDNIEKYQKQGKSMFETVHLSKTGKEIAVEINARVIEIDNKKRVLAMVRDIGKRTEIENKLEEEKDRLQAILDATMDSFWVVDTKGNIRDVNDAFTKMIGYSKKELLKMKIQDLEALEKPQETEEHIKKIFKQGYDRFITKHKCKNGKIIDIEVSVSLLNSLEQPVFVVFAHDITERKKRKEKLEEHNLKLKDNQEELMSSYEEIYAMTEELLSTQNELVETNEKLNQQLENGRKLHEQFLTSEVPRIDDISFSDYFQPAEIIGGDFYNVVELDNQILFYIVDITGHGLEGAFLNLFLKETIDNYLFLEHKDSSKLSPSKLMEHIKDRYKKEDFPDDYFITLLLFVFDKESKEISYSNAGFQIRPLLATKDGISYLTVPGYPISGALDYEDYAYQEESFYLKKGAKMLLTTDGLIEERINGKLYGIERLKNIFVNNVELPPQLIIDSIKDDFQKFSGGSQQDDITLFLLEREDIEDKIEFEIESNLNNYDHILDLKERISDFIRPYYEEVEMLIMGFQEIVVNAIEHGNQQDIDKEVNIKAIVTRDYIKFEVKDEGEGFKWNNKTEQELDPNDLSERGRGIIMTKMIYDYLYYNSAGNMASLVKLRE